VLTAGAASASSTTMSTRWQTRARRVTTTSRPDVWADHQAKTERDRQPVSWGEPAEPAEPALKGRPAVQREATSGGSTGT